MWRAYIFEAKGIQSYILAGGRLRHVAGGSTIVHDLCAGPNPEGLLDRVLFQCGLSGRVQFLRRAGGSLAFALPDATDSAASLSKFHLLWTLAVQKVAPGLPFVDAVAEGETVHDAMTTARRAMSGRRGFAAHPLPVATPPALRASRTGNAAVDERGGDFLDVGLAAKEDRVAQDRANPAAAPLLQLFIDGSVSDDWPTNMETDFPFVGEDRTVAIFHADGNRMGELVQVLGDRLKSLPDADYCARFSDFSQTVDKITKGAVASASEWINAAREHGDGCYPARPIVCAGDDLTIIFRADIALPFAERFLTTFETQAKTALLPKLQEIAGDQESSWPTLTACGGLVYCHVNQPFLSVSALAESACAYAKSIAKKRAPDRLDTVPSCLTIHRVTGSLFESYEDILRAELMPQGSNRQMTANPYAIKAGSGLAVLQDLKDLVTVMTSDGAIGGGVYREIASLLYVSEDEGRLKIDRIRERALKNVRVKRAWTMFEEAYDRLMSSLPNYDRTGGLTLFAGNQSPYNDAIALRQIGQRAEKLTGDAK